MRIGIISPVSTGDVRHLLDSNIDSSLFPGYPGAPFIATLISEYLHLGHEVVAFTSDRTLDVSNPPRCLEGKGFRLWLCASRPGGTLPKQGHIGRIWDLFRIERKKLREAVSCEQVDILHAHWSYEFAMVAREAGIPALVTMHDIPEDILRYTLSPYYFGRYLMAKTILASKLPLTVVSQFLMDRLNKKGIEPLAVIANPLPVWIKDLTKNRTTPPVNGRFFIISMVLGYWSRFKNPLVGIKAFANIRKTMGSGIELRLYGHDFGPAGKAEKRILAAGVSLDGIRLCGGLAHRELLTELSLSDVLMHTSITESFGMAVAEAMALGVPVIGGSSSGAIPWLLDYGKAGQLVNIYDTTEIEEAILWAIENPDGAKSCADYAQQRIREISDSKTVALQYVKTYQQILHKENSLVHAGV